MFDGDAFDAGALGEDSFISAEVGVCWCHIAQAFVVAVMVIVLDERLDLALGLRMIRCCCATIRIGISVNQDRKVIWGSC